MEFRPDRCKSIEQNNRDKPTLNHKVMKNYAALALSIPLLFGLGLGLSSCKDDEPPVPPKVSFAQSEMSVNEADGVMEVELKLDRPYGKDLSVEYKLAGTANDQAAVGTADADYEISGNPGVTVIESGQTTGVIEIEIYNDNIFEEDETIEITIVDVNTSDVVVGADSKTVITITSDDASVVASFVNTSLRVNESDGMLGILKIPVQLDKAAPAETVVNYTLGGSALDSLTGDTEGIPPSYYDYYVDGVLGELTFAAGATSDTIRLQLYSDFLFEDDETIEITLDESSGVDVGTNAKTTITVDQQDGKVIALVWDDNYTDVDMDMFLWMGPDHDQMIDVAGSVNSGPTPRLEIVFVPDIFVDAAFGVSYVYYSGTVEPMNFEAHFADFKDGILEAEADRDVYPATYMLDNINKWDKSGKSPLVVQTFLITDGVLTDVSAITVPETSSRMKALEIPPGMRKTTLGLPRSFKF